MDYLFCERFKELLKESNYTYEELKGMLGIKSKGTITKYSNGDIKNVPFGMVEKIAEIFNVSPVWLIGWTDDKHYVIKK